MNSKNIWFSSWFLGLLLCTAVQAENSPMTIEADTIRYDSKTGVSILEGNVYIAREGLEINADRAEHINDAPNSESIVVNGQPVQITYQPPAGGSVTQGSADQVRYDLDIEELQLIGNAVLNYEQTTLRAQGVSFNMRTGEKKTFDDIPSATSEERSTLTNPINDH